MIDAFLQPYSSIDHPNAGTIKPPNPTPDHIIPKAKPLFLLNQFATAADAGTAIPILCPKAIAPAKTSKNETKPLTLLSKTYPSPINGIPININFLGPTRSINKPSKGPKKPASNLANEKMAETVVRLQPNSFPNGIM